MKNKYKICWKKASLAAVSVLAFSSCSVFTVEHEKGRLPDIKINSTKYFCENGDADIDIDNDEIVLTCRIKL